MKFRPLSDLEVRILKRLLTVNDPAYSGLIDQIPGLLGSSVSDWGTIALGKVEGGTITSRYMHGALPYIGVARDTDGVPIQFLVLVDKDDQLCELEITKLDGRAIIGNIQPEMIDVRRREAGMTL